MTWAFCDAPSSKLQRERVKRGQCVPHSPQMKYPFMESADLYYAPTVCRAQVSSEQDVS